MHLNQALTQVFLSTRAMKEADLFYATCLSTPLVKSVEGTQHFALEASLMAGSLIHSSTCLPDLLESQ